MIVPAGHKGVPIIIPADRAFWILDFYRTKETRLAFGGKILGEEAACAATVQHVWPETESVGLKLWSDDNAKTWDRLIPLNFATFALAQIGDPDFEGIQETGFHSILTISFPDGTTMFLAESAAAI